MEGNGENSSSLTHRKIQRLVKNGQPPAIWCSVCGYACRTVQSYKKCVGVDCPNYSHISCMLPNAQNFECLKTADLRVKAGISEPVEYADSVPEENSESSYDEEDDSELNSLTREELVTHIKNLRKELSSKNCLLSSFETLTEDLASKRDAVVTVLNLIDNIQSVKTSSAILETRTIACSAVSRKIDSEWQTKISSTTTGGIAARNWWRSKTANTPSETSQVAEEGETQEVVPSNQEQDTYEEEITQPHRRAESNIAAQPRINDHNRGEHTRQSLQRDRNTRSNYHNRRPGYASQSCSHCGKRGHDRNRCRKLQLCDFCRGQGHTRDNCRTKQAEDRQRTLLETLSSQQTRNTEILARSLKNILNENLGSKYQREEPFYEERQRHRPGSNRTYSQQWNRNNDSYRQRY